MDWQDKVAHQMSSKLHEDEKKQMESTKQIFSNQLTTMTVKLKQTENELITSRIELEDKTKNVTEERDQAIEQMNVLRNKLSTIIKEKMKFESESKSR